MGNSAIFESDAASKDLLGGDEEEGMNLASVSSTSTSVNSFNKMI